MLRLILLSAVLSSSAFAVAQNEPINPNQLPQPGMPTPSAASGASPVMQPGDPTAPTAFPAGAISGPVIGSMSGNVNRQPGTVRISGGVMAGQIRSRVDPIYPEGAKQNHVEGTVVLSALIGKDGSVKNLQAISGPSDLREAAMTAVRQWTYSPYQLNGKTVDVSTTVTVNFHRQPAQ